MGPRNDLLEHAQDLFPPPDDGLERLWKRQRRRQLVRRLGATATAVAIVALGAFAVNSIVRSMPAPDPATPTPSGVMPGPSMDVSFIDIDAGQVTSAPWDLAGVTNAQDFETSPDGSTVVFEGEPSSGGGAQLFLADADGGGIRQLTHDPITATDGRWSPDGREVVFRSGFDSGAQVAIVDATTGRTRAITGEGAIAYPSFSPDGTSVLFTMATHAKGGGWRADLWTVPSSGGDPSVLVPLGAFGAYSPDGGTIAYHRTSIGFNPCPVCWQMAAGITFTNADGGGDAGPTHHGQIASIPTLETSVVRWSPDGTAVMFVQPFTVDGLRDAITIVDTTTRQRRVIGWGSAPSWRDNHTLVASEFEGGPDLTPPLTPVSFVDVDTGRSTPLPTSLTAFENAANYQVSPDGLRVLFSADAQEGEGGSRIYLADLDGSHVQRLTTGSTVSQARWSPEGDRIVYRKGGGLDSSLEVMDLRTGQVATLVNGDYITWPSFSPDGETVLFTMATNTQNPSTKTHLWTVPSTGGQPTVLVSWGAYGMYSPDGASIAYHQTDVQPNAYCGVCWWIAPGVRIVPSDGSVQPGGSGGGTIAPPQIFEPSVVSWSPAGTMFAFLGPDAGTDTIKVHVVQNAETHLFGYGDSATWFDDNTLIVTKYRSLES